jgi:pantoate--beta-alanine ligase
VSLAVVRTVEEVREYLAQVRHDNKRIGLVPTMGALHHGHASLIEKARSGSDFVVVSIFVNPLQFGPGEDYLVYPRPIEKDLEVCRRTGANLIFAPEVKDIYVSDQRAFVEVARLGDHLCGPFRPGHFRGVATVVAKLFNIIQPDEAYFGEKDYQQLCIIRRMVQDLNFGIAIRAVPTYRDDDGLALSSRNAYLESAERSAAPALFRALTAARRRIEEGERKSSVVKEAAAGVLAAEPLVRVQYLEVVDPLEVQPVIDITAEVRIAGAIWVGKTRLIDNVAAVPH